MSKIKNFFERELRGKLRVWLSWIILPLILYKIDRTPEIEGVFVVLAGGAVRFWASGILSKEGELCNDGPYQFSRNPLYLGSIMIAIGVPISQYQWGLSLFVLLASLAMYYPLIRREEGVLIVKFADQYREYCKNVGRFFSPILFLKLIFLGAFSKRTAKHHFSWGQWSHNKGWEPVLVSVALLIVAFLISKYLQV